MKIESKYIKKSLKLYASAITLIVTMSNHSAANEQDDFPEKRGLQPLPRVNTDDCLISRLEPNVTPLILALFESKEEETLTNSGVMLPPSQSLLTENMDDYERAKILKAVSKIPPEERERVVYYAKLLITEDMDGDEQAAILKAVSDVPAEDRESVINCSKLLITEDMYADEQADILKAVSNIPAEDRESVVSYAQSLISTKMIAYMKVLILRAVNEIPAHERESAIYYAKPLIDESMYIGKQADIIKAVSEIPAHERESVIYYAKPLITENMDGFGYGVLFESVSEIPADERKSVVNNLNMITSPNTEVDAIGAMIQMLRDIDHQKRKNLCRHISKTCGKINKPEIMLAFLFIPLDVIALFLEHLNQLSETEVYEELFSPNNAFAHVFGSIQGNNGFRDIVFNHWQQLFLEPNERLSRRLATLIHDNYELLGLYEEHEIAQEAKQILLLLERSNDPSNPYYFYRQTLNKRNDPVDWALIQLPIEVIDGCRLTLNPAYLKSLTTTSVLLADLPPITRNLLKELDAGIRAKIQAMPALASEIVQNYSAAYDALYQGCLGSALLQNLLDAQGDKQGHVPFTSAKMIAIAAFLGQLPNQVSEDEMLSIQEQTFLQLMASIQHCSTGKQEGIHLYYNNLPSDYKIKGLSTDASDAEKGRQWVDSILRKEIEDLLSGTTRYFQALIGMQPHEQIEQPSHQARYVKNVIAEEVGLGNLLSFDRHSAIIYQKLIDTPKQQMLQQFYRHFLPYRAHQALLASVQRELQANAEIYTWLAAVLSEAEQEAAWEIDLNSGTISLTERGALVLLKKLNILLEPVEIQS